MSTSKLVGMHTVYMILASCDCHFNRGSVIPCRYVVAYHLDEVYSLHAMFEEQIFCCLRFDVFTFLCADLGG